MNKKLKVMGKTLHHLSQIQCNGKPLHSPDNSQIKKWDLWRARIANILKGHDIKKNYKATE